MRGVVLIIVAFLSVSCASNRQMNMQDNPAVVFFGEFKGGVLPQQAVSRATPTAFEQGDQLGVFGVIDGQQLGATGNRINNACFMVDQNGQIKGDPTVYYPDSKQAVAIFAYYPYSSTVGDATKFMFSVQADQSGGANIKKSDLCYARQDIVPSSEAQKLSFRHMHSRLIFSLTNNSGLGISSVRLLEVGVTSMLNLGDGSISTQANATLESIKLDPSASTQAIVPAQTIKAGRQLLEVVLSDGTRYTFTPQTNDITFSQAEQTTFSLILNDNHTITLNGAPVVEAWVTDSSIGLVEQGVNNSFTAHWVLPHPQANQATRVVVSVTDPRTNKAKHYDCQLTVTNDELPAACSYTFSFVPDPDDLLSYSYRIDSLTFYNQSTHLQRCLSLVAVNIYKRGAYTIGINQNNILEVVVGSVIDWGSMDVSGGISGAGVDNEIEVQMIEPVYDYTKVDGVRLTIGGVEYEWSSGITLQVGHNKLLARLSSVKFPAQGVNKTPTLYPYVVQQVELLDGSTVIHRAGCYVAVGRPGDITLQLIDGGVVGVISGAVGGWLPKDESGSIDNAGSVIGNVFGLVFRDIQLGAKSVTSMELTINGRAVTFGPYNMEGSVLQAKSDRGIDIISGQATGTKPIQYPYSVTNVKLYNGATEMVSMPLSLKVPSSGDVLIQVVR